MENIVLVTFDTPSKAYQALSVLKENDKSMRISLQSAVVVERQEDGRPIVRDGVEDYYAYTGSVWGGLIGALIGVLGGPVGIAAGWGVGAIAGATGDALDMTRSESIFSTIGDRIAPGQTALIADVDEYANEVIDSAMTALGGIVTRESAEDVNTEVKAAKAGQRDADRAARRRELSDDHNERIDHIESRLAKVEGWLDRRKDTGSEPTAPTA